MTETEIERLVVRLVGESSSYQNMMNQAQQTATQTTKHIEQQTQQIQQYGNGLSVYGVALGTFLGNTLTQFAQLGIAKIRMGMGLAADAEQTQIAFEVMLGSGEKAVKMIKDLKTYSDKSPFDQLAPREAAKLLLNFGVEADKVVNTVKMLGDVASGDRNKLMSFALVFGQMTGMGKLQGQDLMQFVNAGFNPLMQLAEEKAKLQGGKATDYMPGLRKEMEQGKISTERVVHAFQLATAEGGRFFGMTDRQAGTVTGTFSTLKDDLETFWRDIGTAFNKAVNLSAIISATSQFVNQYKPMILDAVVGTIKTGVEVWEQLRIAGLSFYTTFMPVFTQIQQMGTMAFDSVAIVGIWAFEQIEATAIAVLSMLTTNTSISFEQIRNFILDTLIAVEYVFKNIPEIAAIAWLSLQLGFFQWSNTLVHALTVQLPIIFSWFANNFTDIMFTAFDYVSTIFINLGKNIRSVWQATLDFIQGKGFTPDWTDLTEGATSAIKKLPEIPERMVSEVEKNLMRERDQLAAIAGENYSEFRDTRLTNLKEQLPKSAVEGLSEAEKVATDLGTTMGNNLAGAIKATKPLDAALAGSAEALHRISDYLSLREQPKLAMPSPSAQKQEHHMASIDTGIQRLVNIAAENNGGFLLSPANLLS